MTNGYNLDYYGYMVEGILKYAERLKNAQILTADDMLDGNRLDSAFKALVNNKVDKIAGKGLSANDFTTTEKTKLGSLPTNEELGTMLGKKVEHLGYKTLDNLQSYINNGIYTVGVVWEGETNDCVMSVDVAGANINQIFYFIGKETDKQGVLYHRVKSGGQPWGEMIFKGKLSTNDYTTAEKNKLGALPTNADLNTAMNLKADKSNTYTKVEVDTELSLKVDKEPSRGLSESNYTPAEKSKLADIEPNANVNKIEQIAVNATIRPIHSDGKTVNIDLTGYVEKDGSKVLSDNNYTTAEKNKLANLKVINLGGMPDLSDLDDITDGGFYHFWHEGDTHILLVGYDIQSIYNKDGVTSRTFKNGYWTEWKNDKTYVTNLGVKDYLHYLDNVTIDGIYMLEATLDFRIGFLVVQNSDAMGLTQTFYGADMNYQGMEVLRRYYNSHEGSWSDFVSEGSLINNNELTKLNNIESNAQVNKIEKIKVNGTEQDVSNKAVNLEIVDSQGIVDCGEAISMVVIYLSPDKTIYQSKIIAYSGGFVDIYGVNLTSLENKNYRFELILEVEGTEDDEITPAIPIIFLRILDTPNTSGEVEPTWIIPPSIEFPHTINKFAFETFDGGQTWYGNQCYSYEVIE